MPNEIQTVSFSPAPTGGTYTLTFYGQTTGSINYNDDAATIQAALEALSTIGTGNISVSGEADAGPIVLTFQGALAATNVPQTTCDASGLTAQATIGAATEVTSGENGSPATFTFSDPYHSDWSDIGSDNNNFSSVWFTLDGTAYIYAPANSLMDNTATLAANGWIFSPGSPGQFSVSATSNGSGHTVTAVTFYSMIDSGGDQNIYNPPSAGTTFTDGFAGIAEVQNIPQPAADGGDFAISSGGMSNTVAYPFTTSSVQSCVDSALGAGAATATGADGGPWTITWNAPGPQSLLAVDGSELTQSVTPAAGTTQDGGLPIASGSILTSAMILCGRACA